MSHFNRANARIYYEDVGRGEPILATHGLAENTTYWSAPGVTAKLAERYRLIAADMRGHGRTVVDSEPRGFDVDTVASDLGALADHLGLERFHVLAHSTGGMAAVRYAQEHSQRLLSLMLTDTGPATVPLPEGIDPASISCEMIRRLAAVVAQYFRGQSWDSFMARSRQNPEPFFNRFDHAPDPGEVWGTLESLLRLGDPETVADFCEGFYTDPDPRLEQLRTIRCPTLVLLGEYDRLFIGPSRLMACEIPDVRHVVFDGLGHMTAVEDPDRLTTELLDFLQTVAETGRARR